MKTINTSEPYLRGRRDERQEYACVYCVMLAVFLFIAIISRILPRSFRPLRSGTASSESIWQEAKRTTQTALGFAYMH